MSSFDFHEALEELGEVLKKEMQRLVPVDTGKLKNSIDYYIENNTLIFIMEDYGEMVNEGTKPHMPPISAIEGWSKRKGINPWALAKSIDKYGTRAQNFMQPLEDFEKDYFKILDDATYDVLEGLIWDKISKYKK